MKLSSIEYKELSFYTNKFEFGKFLQDKTILITGSKGLVGTSLIKWLLLQNSLNKTNTHIVASTRNPDEIPDYIEKTDNIEFIKYGTESSFSKSIDYIVHAASPTGNQYHMLHPVETFKTNVDGIETMLELAKNNKECMLIYLSSEEVYGLPPDDSPAMREDMFGAIDSMNLRSCYPLGKKASEFLCYAYVHEYGVKAKIIRPTVIHGLFQRYEEPRVANELLRCIIENKDLIMKSDGLTKKCIMYSLDAASAIFTVLFKGNSGEAYNATNPATFLTVNDLANYLFNRFNPNLKIVFDQEKANKNDGFLPHRTLLQDCTKLMKLGWEPIASLDHIYEVDIERFGQQC